MVRPEGAEAPSPGQRPGCNASKAKRPVRAKALIMNAFALTGRIIYNIRLPRAMPWARRNLGFQPALFDLNDIHGFDNKMKAIHQLHIANIHILYQTRTHNGNNFILQ